MTRRTEIAIIAMCLPECSGSTSPMRILQLGQLWVYFLNPGRQLTRQLAIQDPQRQQMIAQAQPVPEILESTLVEISLKQFLQTVRTDSELKSTTGAFLLENAVWGIFWA